MRIEEVHIQNFRGFEDVKIQFPKSNVCVFIGANGSGKTTLLNSLSNFLLRVISDISNKLTPLTPIFFTETVTDEDINLNANIFRCEVYFSLDNENGILENNRSKGKGGEWKYSTNKALESISKPPVLVIYPADRNLRYGNRGNINNETNNPLFTYHLAFGKTSEFQDFLEWFRLQEDKENELKIRERNLDFISPALQNIREAINVFFTELGGDKFSDLRVERENSDIYLGFQGNFSSVLSILKEQKRAGKSQRFNLHQLSDGEKVLLMTISDIARRISIIDDKMQISECNGIVLIDEIELHLHPQWQRNVIPALRKTFPNIQFIITTHSPQVLSNVDKTEIRILKDWKVYLPSIETLGGDTNSILPLMETSIRPLEVDIELDEIFKLINDKNFEEAQKRGEMLVKNKKISPNDAVFKRIDSLKTRMAIIGK